MAERVVQVVFGKVNPYRKMGGHSHTYSYAVPLHLWTFMLGVGTTVVVPPNWAHEAEQLATVVDLGRGDYNGPLQEITGVVQRPPVRERKIYPSPLNSVAPGTEPTVESIYSRLRNCQAAVGKLNERIERLERLK